MLGRNELFYKLPFLTTALFYQTIMSQEPLPIDQLAIWAEFNHVDFNGVKACGVAEGKGTGLVATWECQDSATLLSVPQDLVLSLENVWIYAKSDQHLLQILEAVGDYSRVNLTCTWLTP